MYVGFLPLHSSTVGLICNLQTGNISPQFHLIYDDWFETVHATAAQEPEVWQELIKFSRFANDFDDEQYVPELSKEWLNKEEVEQRQQAELQKRQGHQPSQREQTLSIPDSVQAPAVPSTEVPAQSVTVEPAIQAPQQREPESPEPQVQPR